MYRSKTSVLLLVCAALLVAVSFSLPVADAQEKPAGVSFETIPTGDYRVDPGHSVIGFSIRHFEISFVRGRFKDFTSTIHFDAADMTKSTVEFTAKVESIDTGVGGRDNHLRSADFFDVEKFPEIKFESNRIEKRGKSFVAHGTLTMHGVSKEIALPFSITGSNKDATGKKMNVGYSARVTLNRRDFGINWQNQNAPNFVGDNIDIEIDLITRAIDVK